MRARSASGGAASTTESSVVSTSDAPALPSRALGQAQRGRSRAAVEGDERRGRRRCWRGAARADDEHVAVRRLPLRGRVSGPSASRHSTSSRPPSSNGAARQPDGARERGMLAPRLGQPPGEGDQRRVGRRPVDPGDRVVLGVGVVVAALAVAEFRAHRQHRRSARDERQREQIAHVARARREDRGIVARALDAVVPGEILVRSPSRLFSPLASLCLCA